MPKRTNDSRIVVKASLNDGTVLKKVIWYDSKKVDQKTIVEAFTQFINNLIIRPI